MAETILSHLRDIFKPGDLNEINYRQFKSDIITGKYADLVYQIRQEADKKKRQNLKKKLPAITPSGHFKYKDSQKENLISHSGYISIDIDNLDPDEIPETKQKLADDPYVDFVSLSVSGNGLFAFVRVLPSAEKHKAIAANLIDYYRDTYDIYLDKACKDLPRLRYYSHDPDAIDKMGEGVKVFRKTALPKNTHQSTYTHHIFTDGDLNFIFENIKEARRDIAPDYSDWIKVGFALFSHYGQSGWPYFDLISQYHKDYDPKAVERKWKQICKAPVQDISIGSLFYYCDKAGVPTQRSEVKVVFRVAKNTRLKGGKKETAVKFLKDQYREEVSALSDEELDQLVDKTYNVDIKAINDDDPIVTRLLAFIQQFYPLRKNEVTGFIERPDGTELEEDHINDIYINACMALGDKVNRNDVKAIVHSSVAEPFNPIIDWFEARAHRRPEGIIKALVKTIITPTGNNEKAEFGYTCPHSGKFYPISESYAEYFITKWLVGIVASAHGHFCRLQLVLAGGQNTGKTTFFREILPKALRPFYAESKFDKGKDDEILMCRKLIMMDDELGGKSKRDLRAFKELSSKQEFTVREPYGRKSVRLRRLAVLAGTSNPLDILDDYTGNTRIVPIEVTYIDHDAYNKINKDDLFMEAYHLFKDGASWNPTPADVVRLNAATKAFEAVTFEEELLLKYFESCEEDNPRCRMYTSADMQLEIMENTKLNNINRYAFSQALKKHNFSGSEKTRRNSKGVPGKYYNVIPKSSYHNGFNNL